MKSFQTLYVSLAITSLSFNAWSQSAPLWQKMEPVAPTLQESKNQETQYIGAQYYRLDIATLEQLMPASVSHTKQENSGKQIISLPLPSGEMVQFSLKPSLIMEPPLAEKYPSIKTFIGTQVDNPHHQGRFDITPHGFHGMFNYQGQRIFIDPIAPEDRVNYRVYDAKKAKTSKVFAENLERFKTEHMLKTSGSSQKVDFGTELRTYRIAVSAAGEYTTFHGGTKELGLAAITTAINRINQVYNKDAAINLVLVANNDKIIYTDANTDPFDNNSTGDISTNQTIIDDNIGSANYDIGHIFNTGGGGLAGIRVVCSSRKAEGVTGSGSPTNDSFYIDYVAHEVGHQFGGNHTFNGSAGSCNGNRTNSAAYEPGSASTIMGYAGICGSQNVQKSSDDYFHAYSIEQFRDFITQGGGSNCGTTSSLNNQVPSANAGSDFTIPAQTPFMLKGSASDADAGRLRCNSSLYE